MMESGQNTGYTANPEFLKVQSWVLTKHVSVANAVHHGADASLYIHVYSAELSMYILQTLYEVEVVVNLHTVQFMYEVVGLSIVSVYKTF